MDLNFRQIRAFVSVAQLGSFTRAATALHVSQPALTVQIRKLEEALHSRLLDRNSRSVALTRAGRELLPSLQRMVQEMEISPKAFAAAKAQRMAGRNVEIR